MNNQYVITLQEIKFWPPDTSFESHRSALICWKHDKKSPSTPIEGHVINGRIGQGVAYGKIEFTSNNSFELQVALSRDMSGTSKIEFSLYAGVDKNLLLATAIIDLAKYDDIVLESKEDSVPMEGEFKTRRPPTLRFKIETKYSKLYKESIKNPAKFWSHIASKYFYWKQKWEHVYYPNLDVANAGNKINIEWFKGGVTNICYNCLDRHIELGNGDKEALLWAGNKPGVYGSLTYKQLRENVCQLANFLKNKKVKKGDIVIIYLPMIMELPITMLACARIGAVHLVVAESFAESLRTNFMDYKPKIVVTCNAFMRGETTINLKEIVDRAISESGISVDCLICDNGPDPTKRKANTKDILWKAEVSKFSTKCDVEWVDAEDRLFLLNTRGSTGKPKVVVHTTGGYMIYTATTFKYAFDYKESDVYWCTADFGWNTGLSYVTYGPLLNGATVVLYDGTPNYPKVGRWWKIVDKYKVTLFYTTSTLVRSIMGDGKECVTRRSRKSLRVLGSVGEPIDESSWGWFFDVVGDSRCPISDIWWQPETGVFLITHRRGPSPQKPGSTTFPFFGIEPVIVDDKGVKKDGECSGYLWIKNSWPGVFRTTHSKRPSGYYFIGDSFSRDKDGYYHRSNEGAKNVINDRSGQSSRGKQSAP